MNNRFKVTLNGVIGLIVIITTLSIFFLLSFQKTTISWWALSFILISEIALFVGLEVINSVKKQINNVFIGSGLSTTLIINFFITTIISIFSNTFEDVNSFIITEIIILAISIIIILLLLLFSKQINHTEHKSVNDQKEMCLCEKRIYNILIEANGVDYERELSSLYESFKYLDKIGNSTVDHKIVTLIDKLEESFQSRDNETKEILNEIKILLHQRKNEISMLKRGAY